MVPDCLGPGGLLVPRKLRVGFRSEASFRKEYAQNIAKGGLFIPTRHAIEIRESVEVELALSFAGQSVILPGEVKCSSPPASLNKGLIATCSMAIPEPIRNREKTAVK